MRTAGETSCRVLTRVVTRVHTSPMTTTKNSTARIDHSALGKGVVCEHCGSAIQVSKRHIVTHASNGRRACPGR